MRGSAVLLVVGVVSLARTAAADDAKAGHMTCGQMIAARSVLPKKLAEVLVQAAEGLEAHAKLMSKATDANAQAEARALTRIAGEQRKIASEARKLAVYMEAQKDLAPSPTAEKAFDMKVAADQAIKLARLQRELATLLSKDAKHAEAMAKSVNVAHRASPGAARERSGPYERMR